jgi:hypothetical protein
MGNNCKNCKNGLAFCVKYVCEFDFHQIVVNLINGQRKLWSIRGSQMQTFMRMEALAR